MSKRMSYSAVAAAVYLGLSATVGLAAELTALRADANPAAPPAAAAAPATPAAPPSGDAAAKHAKRTACLRDAKAKKLVGAEKNSFLKICIAKP